MRDKLRQYKNKIETQMEKDREQARMYLKEGKTEYNFCLVLFILKQSCDQGRKASYLIKEFYFGMAYILFIF